MIENYSYDLSSEDESEKYSIKNTNSIINTCKNEDCNNSTIKSHKYKDFCKGMKEQYNIDTTDYCNLSVYKFDITAIKDECVCGQQKLKYNNILGYKNQLIYIGSVCHTNFILFPDYCEKCAKTEYNKILKKKCENCNVYFNSKKYNVCKSCSKKEKEKEKENEKKKILKMRKEEKYQQLLIKNEKLLKIREEKYQQLLIKNEELERKANETVYYFIPYENITDRNLFKKQCFGKFNKIWFCLYKNKNSRFDKYLQVMYKIPFNLKDDFKNDCNGSFDNKTKYWYCCKEKMNIKYVEYIVQDFNCIGLNI